MLIKAANMKTNMRYQRQFYLGKAGVHWKPGVILMKWGNISGIKGLICIILCSWPEIQVKWSTVHAYPQREHLKFSQNKKLAGSQGTAAQRASKEMHLHSLHFRTFFFFKVLFIFTCWVLPDFPYFRQQKGQDASSKSSFLFPFFFFLLTCKNMITLFRNQVLISFPVDVRNLYHK